MIETDFLQHLKRLSLIVDKRVNSNYGGERPSTYTGHGLLFKDHRIYAQGDDHRDIDWKIFARTDKLHVKRFEEERNLIVHVVLDASASMGYGSRTMTKFDYASMLGIGFAYMALRHNERFVLSTFAESLERFDPKKGKKQLTFILDYLKQKKPAGESKFEGALLHYAHLITHKALVVIISDFLYDPDEIERVLSQFKDSKTIFIQVLDPHEKDLQLKGAFRLRDVETNTQLQTLLTVSSKKDYEEKLREHTSRIKWLAESVGARFYSFVTDTPIFDAFYDVLRE